MTPFVKKIIAAFLLSGAVLSACSVYPHSLLDPVEDGAGGGGKDAGGAGGGKANAPGYGRGFWSGPNADGCFSVKAPTPQQRPQRSSSEQLPAIYLAIDSLILGAENPQGVKDGNAWQGYGLDLDGTCTGSPTCPGSEDTPPVQTCAAKTPKVPVDGNDCRDNTFGKLESGVADTTIGKTYHLTDDSFNCGLCLGRFTFIIKISRYNGEAADGDVRVDLYASPGLEQPIAFQCDTDWRSTLYDKGFCWQNNQPFLVEQSSMDEPTAGPELSNAKIFDDSAYVRDGYLVMAMPPATRLWFPHTVSSPIYTFPFVLGGGVTVGKLTRLPDTTWTVEDGLIAGWSKGTDLVEGFERLGFCEGKDPLYPFMKTLVANNLDLLSSGGNNPAQSCDAISVGIPFKARQATVGGLINTPFPERCAPNVPPK